MNFDFHFAASTSSVSSESSTSPCMFETYERQADSFECLMNGSMVTSHSGIPLQHDPKTEHDLIQTNFNNRSNFNEINDDFNVHQTNKVNKSEIQNQFIERVNFPSDYSESINKFQYVIMAPTSPAVKINEDTLTYLNQGQNYELKLNRIQQSQKHLQQVSWI